jgi:hypothetical protein
MMGVDEPTKFILALDEVERTQLLTFLEEALRDTHVEARRTEVPRYQEVVHHREQLLRSLIEKLRPV